MLFSFLDHPAFHATRQVGKIIFISERLMAKSNMFKNGTYNGQFESSWKSYEMHLWKKIPTFTESFQREITFRRLYDFQKRHNQYKYSSQTQHESCTFEICENIKLLTSAVNRKLKNVDSKLPARVKEIVGEYSCDVANKKCMKSVYPQCPWHTITSSDFEDSSSSPSNSDDSSRADSDEKMKMKCYQWLSADGKASKVCVSTRIDETKNVLLGEIRELKLHVLVKNELYNTYNRLKNECQIMLC